MRSSSLVASSWAFAKDDEAGRSLPADAETDPGWSEWAAVDWAGTDSGAVGWDADLKAADLLTDDLDTGGLEAVFWAFEDLVVAGLEAVDPESACLAGGRSKAFLATDRLFDACPVCAAVFSGDLTDPTEPLALLPSTVDLTGFAKSCRRALRAAC